jgi:hypothetical protein
MKPLQTFDEFLNEAVRYLNSDHKEYVEEWGLESEKVPNNLKDLVGKRIKVIKKIKYDEGESPEHGTEGTIRHAYLVKGDLIYSIMSDDDENFEAAPDEVKIIG